MKDVEHRAIRVDLAIWVNTQITELGIDVLWIEEKGNIKKALLHVVVKF